MTPSWLFESDRFGEDIRRLIDEVRRQGMRAEVCNYEPSRSNTSYLDLFGPDDCVVFYGSLGFAEQVKEEAPWVPGVYYTRPAYDCSAYYPELHEFLLAKGYLFMPFGQFVREKDWLYRAYGIDDALFVRPDSGHKLFTGSLVYKEFFEVDTEHMRSDLVTPETMVVVSPPRNVVNEWRFVVVDDEVVAGSSYRQNGYRSWRREYPAEALHLAWAVAGAGYVPDRAWTVDVCETKPGNFYLLEIGTFCCAGLYACDETKVVREVSRVALEDWGRRHA